jgi:aminoglycoside phosphotransferase (APT) family kinase protein
MAEIDAQLREWVEGTTRGRIVAAERPPGGGSRESWLVDVEAADGTIVPLVLRCEAGGGFTGTEISPTKEATVYRALEHTPVPVPRVVALAPEGAALLMERLRGTSEIWREDAETSHAIMNAFTDAIAAMHNLDIDTLALTGFPRPTNAAETAEMEIDAWARLAEQGVPHLDPLARYAGAWLRAHPPATETRIVLVHGDDGPGNFLYEGTEITGLIDWEFAHIGDPMDDWATVGARVQDVDLTPYLARYEAATGIRVDEDRIRFWRVAVDYRAIITVSLAVARGGGARGFPPYLLLTQRYVVELLDRMCALLGVEVTAEVPEIVATPRTPYFDLLLESIRAAVRELTDPAVREATRNTQILVHHLRAYDAVGADVDERDRLDRVDTLGEDALDERRFVQLVEDAGTAGDLAMFRYLARKTIRERLLWQSALDRPRR